MFKIMYLSLLTLTCVTKTSSEFVGISLPSQRQIKPLNHCVPRDIQSGTDNVSVAVKTLNRVRWNNYCCFLTN